MKYYIMPFFLINILILTGCFVPEEYQLTITIEPAHTGFVSSDTDEYIDGASVTLTAIPNAGYIFNYWEFGNNIIETNPLNITIKGNMSITVYFTVEDTEAPVITRFEGPAETTEKQINILLEGSDNIGITGWLVNESPEIPDPGSFEWCVSKPGAYYVESEGQYDLYAWVKDGVNNVSESKSIIVIVHDVEVPEITLFFIPPLTNQAEISITLNTVDNFGISHWLLTESDIPPENDDPAWEEEKPESYILSGPGDHILYSWVKDRSGNISDSKNCEITFDNSPPVVSLFTGPATSTSYTIDITSLDGFDDRGIIRWLLSDTPDTPYTSDSRWSLEKPATYTMTLHGENKVYAWAKDEAGNISTSLSIPVVKYFEGKWTIMIWLDGDNDLEIAAADDFNEIEYGLLRVRNSDPFIEDKLSIIVQYDRINGYDSASHDNGLDWTNTRRYLMKPQSGSYPYEMFSSQLLDNMDEVNMGSAENLKLFIQYCKSEFPADHYGLVLWNHGNGVRKRIANSGLFKGPFKGVCSDNTEDDILYIGEIKKELTNESGVDVIGFDSCYMGMLEVAYEFRILPEEFGAGFMVGTPAVEQVDGWAYNKIIERFMGSNVTDSEGDDCYDIENLEPEQLARIIVKEYSDAYHLYENELIIALDLSFAEDVKQDMDDLVVLLEDKKVLCEIIRGSNSNPQTLDYFDENYEDIWINTPHFDFYDFIDKISDYETDNLIIQAVIGNLKNTLNDFIIESWAGAGYQGFLPGKNGLGFFFPDGDRYSQIYNSYHYDLQYWYTGEDLYSQSGLYYGNIDFCTVDDNGEIENWKELLDFWFN